jgi:hypothetical protein
MVFWPSWRKVPKRLCCHNFLLIESTQVLLVGTMYRRIGWNPPMESNPSIESNRSIESSRHKGIRVLIY